MMKLVLAFGLAVVTAAALGAAISSHFVMNGLAEAGAALTLHDRLTAIGLDLVGFGPVYAAVLAPLFAVGFAIAGWISRRLAGTRGLAFVAIGAASVLAALFALEAVLGLQPVSGARAADGVAAQAMAGAVAGFLFARLTAKPRA
jgi:hypothetical protein